jgi:ABC-type transporter Mla subunit MlaD
MLLATNEALSKDIGLLVTFGGIGLIVAVLVVFIVIQVRGERRQNQEYMTRRRPPGA